MTDIILGLDIGGANLKAATSDGRAVSVPFAVWKHPERLGDELAKLIGQFPEAKSLAVTMTAELCDCYETKREGVKRIVKDLQTAAKKLPIRIWSTDGKFVTPKVAITNYMKVAAANWHCLATYCGRLVPKGPALLIDMGTTTTDLIPMMNGLPNSVGKTDMDRLDNFELLYLGWKRTPATSLLGTHRNATEIFATCADALIVKKLIAEDPSNTDTADGRPMTIPNSLARLARMSCGDVETIPKRRIMSTADFIIHMLYYAITTNVGCIQNNRMKKHRFPYPLILSGSGRFLIERALKDKYFIAMNTLKPFSEVMTLTDYLGTTLEECAPAYALAVLAAEARA